MKRNTISPYKKLEYQKFLEIYSLEKEDLITAALMSQKEIAGTLGVDETTIVAWKKTKKYKEIRSKAISKILKGMQAAGVDDWKMWKDLAKALDVNFKDKDAGINIGIKAENLQGIIVIE